MRSRRRLTRIAAATGASVVALVALARASTIPLPYHDGATARLRLSWTARD